MRFIWGHPGIEQEEIDAATSLDQLGERGLNAGRAFRFRLNGVNTCLLASAAS